MKEPIYVIGYARVSSPKQSQEGDSLSDQARAIKYFVNQNGWTLYPDEVLEEQFTGTKDGRPLYDYAMSLIKKNPGKVKYFIVKVIDRFSRGGSGPYQAMKDELSRHGVELRDMSGVIQPKVNTLEHLKFAYEWSQNSPSQISEVVLAENARSERSAILTRLISAEIGLTQRGFQVGPPNDGFLNEFVEIEGKKRCVLIPDPERKNFFIEMFKLRADGSYSDSEIVERLNGMGYSSKRQKRWNQNKTKVIGYSAPRKLTVKHLQRLITRPAYCGILCEKWTYNKPIKAQWKGLVSIDMFNKANRGKVVISELNNGQFEILYNQNPERLINKRNNFRDDFIFKNVVTCSECHKPLLASYSRGKSGKRFGFYHCCRGHERHSISKDQLEKAYAEYLLSIKFKDKYLENLNKILIWKFRKEEGDFTKKTVIANQHVAMLESKKLHVLESYHLTKNEIVKNSIEQQIVAIQKQIEDAREVRSKMEVEEDDIHAFIAHAKKLMEHPAKMLEDIGNKQEQLALFNLFFEEFPTYQELINRTPKQGLIFKLNEENDDEESLSVTLRRIELRFQE